jgi:ADP-ribosylglycohydrolase
MPYPDIPNFNHLIDQLTLYSQLKHEYGAKGITTILKKTEETLKNALIEIRKLPIDKELAKKEPNDLNSIQLLRPPGPRRLWTEFHKEQYREKVEGALLGRMAGCTLGAPVEFWSIEKMEMLARETGMNFPPTDYWAYVPDPLAKRYETSTRESYTISKMNGVPVDDDIVYTILGLLIVEEFGPDFTTEQVGKAWLKYLPFACTAEKIALENLKAGVPAKKTGKKNNPYCEWIGADIRADPWGYLSPGMPEKAAEMAYRDAYLSHRRQGVYGAMFFSAAIAAAFAVDHPVTALEIGLTEIPQDCALAKIVCWALEIAPQIQNYRQARDAVEQRFKDMSRVHTINNACLTIFGLTIGGTDFTRVIGETVAMGMDNDCTAATAGSIVGAIVGRKGIPQHWYEKFNNMVHTYIIDRPLFNIDELVERFAIQTEKICK